MPGGQWPPVMRTKASHNCHFPYPVAVPDILLGFEKPSSPVDRCHSLSSLTLPPAALASLVRYRSIDLLKRTSDARPYMLSIAVILFPCYTIYNKEVRPWRGFLIPLPY